jgi:hypothetical protein
MAIFFRFHGGKIVGQTDYMCYDPIDERRWTQEKKPPGAFEQAARADEKSGYGHLYIAQNYLRGDIGRHASR